MANQPPKSAKTGIIAIITVLLVGGGAATGSFYWSSQNAYAAKINGKVISTEDYATLLERAKKQQAGQIGLDFDSEKGKEALENLKRNVLNSLIDLELMKQKAIEMKLEVDPAELEKQIKELIQQNYQGNEKGLDEDLKKHNFTKEEFRNQMKDRLLFNKLYQKIIEAVKVTDAEVKKTYEENKAAFESPAKIGASHILFKTEDTDKILAETDEKKREVLRAEHDKAMKQKAMNIIQELKNGADFAKLAKENSGDLSNKDNGGELGAFAKGQMVQPFEEAAWPLKPGELTEAPVKTRFGYHIIKRGKDFPAHTQTLAEVTPQIKAKLMQEKPKEEFENWFKKTREEAQIVVNSELQPLLKEEDKPKPTEDNHDGHQH